MSTPALPFTSKPAQQSALGTPRFHRALLATGLALFVLAAALTLCTKPSGHCVAGASNRAEVAPGFCREAGRYCLCCSQLSAPRNGALNGAPSVTEPESFNGSTPKIQAFAGYPFGGTDPRDRYAFQSITVDPRGPWCLRVSGAVAPSASLRSGSRGIRITQNSPASISDAYRNASFRLCWSSTQSTAPVVLRCKTKRTANG